MTQSSATDCITQIDIAQEKIKTYNTNWNIWNIEYDRLDKLIPAKEIEIDTKDLEFYSWILSELQNNSVGELIQRGNGDNCAEYRGSECSDTCKNAGLKIKTPRGRGPSGLEYYETHKEHCNWDRPVWEAYRCYCKRMSSGYEFARKVGIINGLIAEKTILQNNRNKLVMPTFPPIIIECCDKKIECDNKIYGTNNCFGNLQICKQSNFNILDKSKTTELENNNKAKILKIKEELDPISEQIKESLNSIYNLSKNLRSSFDDNSISNSITNIKKIYDQIFVLITNIETIKNINNVENEAKVLFDYITTDTTHKREMQFIFESIRNDVTNIKNIIKQAKNTFLNIKIIYETLQNEDLNINLLKIEQTKILNSISSLNDYLNNLKILYDTANTLTISSQDELNTFLEIYNRSLILVRNINLKIKDLNEFKNLLTNIYNKFSIDSFFLNDVNFIYNESINNINNIIKKINENNINTIIENIYNLFLKNKNIYESEQIKFDENNLKKIQDEELQIIQSEITNNLKNIDYKQIINNNDIKQEEISGINIIYIVIGIVIFIMAILFFK